MSINFNFMICGHGMLYFNESSYVNEFFVPELSVLTFAPPTAGCMYPPENLGILRKKIHENNEYLTDFDNFFKVIIREEKKTLGFNYCDEAWIGYFGKEQKYDTKKGCGIQKGTIQDKLFTFEDPEDPDNKILGIWDLRTNVNIMATDIPIEPIQIDGKNFYLFSDVMKFLELALGENPINVLDCSCSVIYDQNNVQIIDSRLQRRLQRGIQIKKGGTKRKNKNRKNKKNSRKIKNKKSKK